MTHRHDGRTLYLFRGSSPLRPLASKSPWGLPAPALAQSLWHWQEQVDTAPHCPLTTWLALELDWAQLTSTLAGCVKEAKRQLSLGRGQPKQKIWSQHCQDLLIRSQSKTWLPVAPLETQHGRCALEEEHQSQKAADWSGQIGLGTARISAPASSDWEMQSYQSYLQSESIVS